MDVSELLDFQPKKPVLTSERRVPRPPSPAAFPKRAKQELSDEEKARLLQALEQADNEEPLDDAAVRKMVTVLEKRIARNQEMRIKFADTPDKFMQSEIELNDAIQAFSSVAANPELYASFVNNGGLHLIVNLISHENTDIALTVVNVLEELTDVDSEDESSSLLAQALIEVNCISNLMNCLGRLNESTREDADGVHNILAIIENMFDLVPDLIQSTAIELKLMDWLVARLNAKTPFGSNKLYASEILSICVQHSDIAKSYLGDKLNGVDVLLQQLSHYKRHDPQSSSEIEYMENLFSVLCSVLLLTENHTLFLKGEGLQLMNLMLREKKLSRYGALKTLSFVLNGIDSGECCQKYVDILGLRAIFPLLMKSPKGNKKIGVSQDENEERVIGIIHALIRNCTGTARQRVLLKFTENDHEKVERLIELHAKYAEKVASMADSELTKESLLDDDGEDKEIVLLSKRLEGGLLSLQLIDASLIELSLQSSSIFERVVRLCAVRGIDVDRVCENVRQYGQTFDGTMKAKEKERLRSLVNKFEHSLDM